MTVTMELSGFDEMEEALEQLSKASGKNVLRRALKAAAEPMADLARSLAPNDPSTGGFDLQKSITVGSRLSRREKSEHRRMFRNDRASVEMFVGAGPLPQAVYSEFGTAPHVNKGLFAGTMNPGVAPQPFMRPAWDQDHKALLDRLGKEIWVEIEKAMARAERKAARLAAQG